MTTYILFILDSKDCVIALLLHAVLKPHRIKSGVKPTIEDAQSDFILHVLNINDVVPKLNTLRDEHLKNKSTVQPRIIAVGLDLTQLTDFFVYCDGIKYKPATFIKCIDIVIKLTYVFDLKFSATSKLVWLFFEQYFFDLSSEQFSEIANLINRIKNQK